MLAAVGAIILWCKRIWWPLAVWLLLMVAIVHSSAPFGGPFGALTGKFSDLFYSDPRRLSAVITMLLADGGGIALFTVVAAAVLAGAPAGRAGAVPAAWYAATAALIGGRQRRYRPGTTSRGISFCSARSTTR